MWTLDPIDGTKGFLRGGQYAVCLGLIEDAQVQLGVIGCPNLLVDPSNQDGPRGCLFVAVKGQGAEQVPFLSSCFFYSLSFGIIVLSWAADPFWIGPSPYLYPELHALYA
jgi:Inositol monophosphatase family